MKACIHQPNYLPYLGIFSKIKNSDVFVVYDVAQYVKDRFDNRNLIKTAVGTQLLTIPLRDAESFKKRFYEIKLPENESWKKDHCKSIEVNYRKGKYFQQYYPSLSKIYKKKYKYFANFSIDIIKFLIDSFKINTKIIRTRDIDLELNEKSTEMIVQILKKIRADEYLAGVSGKNYMNEDLLKKSGIKVTYQHFKHPSYNQLFKSPFTENLAAIDLLFNEGPKAGKFI